MVTTHSPLLLAPSRHASLSAVTLPDGTGLTHHDLATAVGDRAQTWGAGRRVVLIEGGNRLDALVAHLAALEHGHVSLLVPEDRPDQRDAMVAAYDPDIVCTADGDVIRRERSVHDLHPDLALLLSTSGTTGSPKLVRLSRANVASNARSIAQYLELGPHSRAITSLPLHYCYGLSVVHSHLAAGGSLALCDLSVVDECFWDFFEVSGATSFAAVPHTFDLLDRAGFDQRATPTLRQVTVAGGRLAPDRVRHWAAEGRADGWELVVMYGQTEATARMAWLPPDLAEQHPGSIGVAVPGGALRIDPVPESLEPGVGELVYTGPNVMMGYAHSPSDLAGGPELMELRTGDLGREHGGLFEVVGRRDRFTKLFGLRLDLGRLEDLLADTGSPAELVATSAAIHTFSTHGRHSAALRSNVADLCGIPVTAVRTHVVQVPRTPNGKIDRAALQRLAELEEAAELNAEDLAPVEDADHAAWVLATVGRLLGRLDVRANDTFVSLGGDSLSFVETAAVLEARLGPLPPQWHTRPLVELAHPAAAPDSPGSLKTRLDTTVAIRALAIVAVVASHVDLVSWEGGAHLLLVLAGFNFARFQLGSSTRGQRVRHGVSSLLQLVVPSVLLIGALAMVTGQYDAPTVFLLNGLFGSDQWNDQWQLWFLEALTWTTVSAVALMSIPAVHRLERRRPYAFALALALGAVAVRLTWTGQQAGPTERYTVGVVAFFFALGWLAARAESPSQRWVVTVLATGSIVGFFADLGREGFILVGVCALLWLPQVPIPRIVASAVARTTGELASASLFIYLIHWQVYPPLEESGHPLIALTASLAVGAVVGGAFRPVQRRLATLITRSPEQRADLENQAMPTRVSEERTRRRKPVTQRVISVRSTPPPRTPVATRQPGVSE